MTFFPNKPARTAVGGAGLGRDALVEIECIAAAPDDEDEQEEEEDKSSDMDASMDEAKETDGE